jgi:hypothetical protein
MVSGADIKAIQGHWNANVHSNLQGVGNALFVAYFAAHPGDQALFKKFANVAAKDLPGNAAFNHQTLAVMSYLDKVVAGLGTNCAQLMKDQVAPHKARHIGVDKFASMFAFLPGFMGDHGADGACVNAWKNAGAALVAAMK